MIPLTTRWSLILGTPILGKMGLRALGADDSLIGRITLYLVGDEATCVKYELESGLRALRNIGTY